MRRRQAFSPQHLDGERKLASGVASLGPDDAPAIEAEIELGLSHKAALNAHPRGPPWQHRAVDLQRERHPREDVGHELSIERATKKPVLTGGLVGSSGFGKQPPPVRGSSGGRQPLYISVTDSRGRVKPVPPFRLACSCIPA